MFIFFSCFIAAVFTAASPFIIHFFCEFLDHIEEWRSDFLDKYGLPNLPYLFIFVQSAILFCCILHLIFEN